MKRTPHGSDALTIGLFAPIVIGARLQMLSVDALKPTAAGRKEAIDMMSEKPLAFMLGGFGLQAELVRQTVSFWTSAMTAGLFAWSSSGASAALAEAALSPISSKVQANARRLAYRPA